MPRIIVMTDETEPAQRSVLLDEYVQSVHLSCDHSATQLLERVGWAVGDAEQAARRDSQAASARAPLAAAHGPPPAQLLNK